MTIEAFEVFNQSTGTTVAVVGTERQAERLVGADKSLDYESVKRSACYCDSAYHPLGH